VALLWAGRTAAAACWRMVARNPATMSNPSDHATVVTDGRVAGEHNAGSTVRRREHGRAGWRGVAVGQGLLHDLAMWADRPARTGRVPLGA
jgi:hypothetical protein